MHISTLSPLELALEDESHIEKPDEFASIDQ